MINLDWQKDAKCQDVDTELFFPIQGESAGQKERAKRWCSDCPVRPECLEYALTVPTLDLNEGSAHWVHGIWGGTTQQERMQIRQRRGIFKKGVV